MTEKRQGATPDVRLFNSYSKMTEKRQGPTPDVRLREIMVTVK